MAVADRDGRLWRKVSLCVVETDDVACAQYLLVYTAKPGEAMPGGAEPQQQLDDGVPPDGVCFVLA